MVKGDIINAINDLPFEKGKTFADLIGQFKVGDSLKILFNRFGKDQTTYVKLGANPSYRIELLEQSGVTPSDEILEKRKDWLKIE